MKKQLTMRLFLCTALLAAIYSNTSFADEKEDAQISSSKIANESNTNEHATTQAEVEAIGAALTGVNELEAELQKEQNHFTATTSNLRIEPLK